MAGELSSSEESQNSSAYSESEDDNQKATASGRVMRKLKEANVPLELLCGVTVALALVPEAVAFALSAGLTPSIGLHSAWVIAFVTAILGGRPAMICGATGSIAVLLGDTVRDLGKEYIFVAVVMMGVIEISLGRAGIGKLVFLIPTPVMIGFCNGLALVIGLAQFNNFKVPKGWQEEAAAGEADGRLLGSFEAFESETPFISGSEAYSAIAVTVVSFCVCLFLPKLTKKIPSALVAIVIGTIVEWALIRAAFHTRTPLVRDIAALHGSLPKIAWLDEQYHMPPMNWETYRKLLPLSITMAAVGLLESLMTLNLIDELTGTKGNTTRECIGQGIACIICGLLGGMGGCAMIGQSMINVSSGARTRLSSATAGLMLLVIVMVAWRLINYIPVSALVGVMFNVVYHTFEWSSLKLIFLASLPLSMREKFFSRKNRSKQKIRRFDALVILVVTLVTLFTDLAIAVAVGMVVACFTFVYDTATQISVNTREEVDRATGQAVKYYEIHGVLFFGSCTQFLGLFDEHNDPDDIRLVFDSGYVADYSAIQALNKLGERYGSLGKTVKLQQLKPGCGKLVEKSAGLLVNEVEVVVEEEEVLPVEREHLNVEHFTPRRERSDSGFSRQSTPNSSRHHQDGYGRTRTASDQDREGRFGV